MSRCNCQGRGVCLYCRAPGCNGGAHDTRQLLPDGFVFAPGVIEGPSRRRWLTPRRVDVLARFVLVLVCLAAMSAALGFAAGYISFGGLQ